MGKKFLIPFAVLVLLILAGGGYYFFSSHVSKPLQQKPSQTSDTSDVVPTLAPSDIGLSFTARDDKKAVKFVIAKPDGIQSVEYTLSYTAKSSEGQDVSQGLIGDATVTSGASTIAISYRELGTCSSGHCRYDHVISPVTLTLKITKSDGKVYQTTDTLDLSS